MPHMDSMGPENKGSKTGRMLGTCKKSKSESIEAGVIGVGRGLRKHSTNSIGRGKRLRYDKTK